MHSVCSVLLKLRKAVVAYCKNDEVTGIVRICFFFFEITSYIGTPLLIVKVHILHKSHISVLPTPHTKQAPNTIDFPEG